jgi:hypothetical protein
MNTKPLTLQEAVRIIETEMDAGNIIPNQDVMEFINRVEDTGKAILRNKGEDVGKYIEDAAEFLFATSASECMEGRDMTDIQIGAAMLGNHEMFVTVIGYAFIYAVGLCATEELR